jgi:hypothetical protein
MKRYKRLLVTGFKESDVHYALHEWEYGDDVRISGVTLVDKELETMYNIASDHSDNKLLLNSKRMIIGYDERLPTKFPNSKRWGKRKVRR